MYSIIYMYIRRKLVSKLFSKNIMWCKTLVKKIMWERGGKIHLDIQLYLRHLLSWDFAAWTTSKTCYLQLQGCNCTPCNCRVLGCNAGVNCRVPKFIGMTPLQLQVLGCNAGVQLHGCNCSVAGVHLQGVQLQELGCNCRGATAQLHA